jgi:hypothetical protein
VWDVFRKGCEDLIDFCESTSLAFQQAVDDITQQVDDLEAEIEADEEQGEERS